DLPLYDEDLDGEAAPAAWRRFREEVRQADAVLFVTPEYNRSVPGLLKNAIDVASRPYGQAAWTGKPAAVMSTSMGALGGFGANHHLRQMLTFFDMPVMQQPEAYVGSAHTLFDADGNLVGESNEAFFKSFIDALAQLVERRAGAKARAAACASPPARFGRAAGVPDPGRPLCRLQRSAVEVEQPLPCPVGFGLVVSGAVGNRPAMVGRIDFDLGRPIGGSRRSFQRILVCRFARVVVLRDGDQVMRAALGEKLLRAVRRIADEAAAVERGRALDPVRCGGCTADGPRTG